MATKSYKPSGSDSSKGKEAGKPIVGVVTEALPNAMFRVLLGNETGQNSNSAEPILAYLAGKMRWHRIKVLIGDRVELWLDPYGGKARIVKRL